MDTIVQNVYGNLLSPERLLRRFKAMEDKKQPWQTKWQEIQDMTFPNVRDYSSSSSIAGRLTPQTSKIGVHCSAITGMITKTVSDLHSQITDPMVKWIGLSFRKSPTVLTDGQVVSLSESPIVQQWLQQCEDSLYDLFADPRSNFYPSTFVFHRDWFTLGTACRHICLRHDTGNIFFNCVSMADIFVDTDAYDQIETVARRYSLTAEQAYSLWGENIGQETLNLLGKDVGTTRKFEYIEMCLPTPAEVRNSDNPFAVAPYLSVVVGRRGKNIVSLAPEISLPYVVSRFDIDPGGLYGRSLVWQSMPDITLMNRLSRRNVQAIDYASSPPILTTTALSLNTRQIMPGAIVQGLDSEGRPQYLPMQMGSNIPISIQFYQQKYTELVDELLANDIIPQDAVGNMSPTEVIRREIQRNNRVRPVLVRLETEDLRFTLQRTLALLNAQGMLMPFPYNSLGLSPEQLPDPLNMIQISFSGQMAKMRRLQDVQNINMLMTLVMQYAQADPSILQLLKLPEAVHEIADIYDIPKELIKTEEELAAEAEAQREAQEAQQAQQQEQEDLQKRMIEGQLEKEGISEEPEDLI